MKRYSLTDYEKMYLACGIDSIINDIKGLQPTGLRAELENIAHTEYVERFHSCNLFQNVPIEKYWLIVRLKTQLSLSDALYLATKYISPSKRSNSWATAVIYAEKMTIQA